MDAGFREGLVKGLTVIGISEIGDKTFFIAALLAMRHSRLTVFAGAWGALAAMTLLSVALGWAAPALIPKAATHYLATGLFFFFGLKGLWDAYSHDAGDSELAEVEQELAEAKGPTTRSRAKAGGGKAGGGGGGGGARGGALGALLSPVLLNAFTLTFLAEWGDRSQLATISLAASQGAAGVAAGSVLGHAACTAAAVAGGRHLAAHINERAVGVVGGLVFLAFGAHALWEGPH